MFDPRIACATKKLYFSDKMSHFRLDPSPKRDPFDFVEQLYCSLNWPWEQEKVQESGAWH